MQYEYFVRGRRIQTTRRLDRGEAHVAELIRRTDLDAVWKSGEASGDTTGNFGMDGRAVAALAIVVAHNDEILIYIGRAAPGDFDIDHALLAKQGSVLPVAALSANILVPTV